MAVASPCVSLCRMDAQSGLCEGCWRSIDEIAAWAGLDDTAKRSVWLAIARRRAQAAPAAPPLRGPRGVAP